MDENETQEVEVTRVENLTDQPAPQPTVGSTPPEDAPRFRGKLVSKMDAGECWVAIKVLRPNHPLAKQEPQGEAQVDMYRQALANIVYPNHK